MWWIILLIAVVWGFVTLGLAAFYVAVKKLGRDGEESYRDLESAEIYEDIKSYMFRNNKEDV